MIAAVVVCPATPLLLRELGGRHDAVPELRTAAVRTLAETLALDPARVVVVGGHERAGTWPPVPMGALGLGTPEAQQPSRAAEPAECPPYSVAVGRRLLDEAGWAGPVDALTVRWQAAPEEAAAALRDLPDEGPVVVLALADLSARRGEGAPGHVDPRAFTFDEEVGRALASGDADALARLDRATALELMVLGWSVLVATGSAVASASSGAPRVDAEVAYLDDPYGVMYPVVRWVLAGPGGSVSAG